jgi:hypothetical protein
MTIFYELLGVDVSQFAEHHYHALTEITLALNGYILKIIVGERFPSSTVESNMFDIRAMENEGKEKLGTVVLGQLLKLEIAARNISSQTPIRLIKNPN